MTTDSFLSLRSVLCATLILLPLALSGQQEPQLTRSEAVRTGQVSAVDVAPGDTEPMLVIPGDTTLPPPGTPRPDGVAAPLRTAAAQPAGQAPANGGSAGTDGSAGAGGMGGATGMGSAANTRPAAAGEASAGNAAQAGTAATAPAGRGGFRSGGGRAQGAPAQGGGPGAGAMRRGSERGGDAAARGAAVAQATDGTAPAQRFAGANAPEQGGERSGASATADNDTVQRLIMRDQGLPEVLNYLELLSQKAILRSQTLPAVKINFDSVGPMSRQEAILAVESLLALNGIAVTPMGERFLKAAPITEVAKQVPQFLSGSALGLPASQQFYTKYFKLDYLDAVNEGLPIVQGLLSVGGKQEGNPVVFPKSNSIMVTDMLINLQRIEEVLTRSDAPNTGATQLTFFKLKHVKADDLKRRLTTLVANKDSSIAAAFSHNTTFEADERTNQLIVATHASNLPLLRQLVEGLDSDVEPQTTSEVYYIKHAEAINIQSLLESVISGQQQAYDQTGAARNAGAAPLQGGAPAGAAPEVAAALANAQAGVNAALSEARTMNFSSYVTVVADERANAIVAYGTRTDLVQIGKLIDQIDILLAQVNIQVIIAEVTLSDGVSTGIEQLNIGYDTAGLVGTGGFGGWSGGTSGAKYTGGDSPFNFTGTLDPKRFSLVIRNAKTNSNFRMLSSPVIVTTHNKEGRVEVTQSRPVITGTSTQLVDNGVTSSTVTYRNIGIKLTVKPLIGNNGIIQMQVTQEVENITDSVSVNGNEQPVIATRMAESYVSVRSGEVVVLAGLQESTITENDNRLWLIGEIPLIGDFLNGTGKKVERRELMIFIQPFIMTTDEEIATMTNQAIDTLDNAGDVRTFLQTRDASSVTIEQASTEEQEPTDANRPVTGPRRGRGR